MPTQEETKNFEVIAEYFSEYRGKAISNIVDKLCADDFVTNYPMHGPRHGKEAAKKMLSEFNEAFPDIYFHAYQHQLISSGPYVVVGALDKPNTGKKMYFAGTTIFTLKDGKIVDETGEEGALTALQNLGLVSQPNPGKEVEYLHPQGLTIQESQDDIVDGL
ncbi:hypothetical protein QQZ08_005163 [Neonectria magnoliae]|uniref:SnoaL-like domain-containing protein n=1 Tax=Neonectria magnoliae TaxID=2732573 RepID=A0ABR1I617_9HYPO